MTLRTSSGIGRKCLSKWRRIGDIDWHIVVQSRISVDEHDNVPRRRGLAWIQCIPGPGCEALSKRGCDAFSILFVPNALT